MAASRPSLRARLLPDLLALSLLLVVSLSFVSPAIVGGKMLLPADNLFRMQPWKPLAQDYGVGAPHNELISDMVLQNVAWKRFAAEGVRAGRPPLWNPGSFGGVPFLAAGQYGVLYPPGVLFYIMPVERAYGWFIGLHLFLGATFAYALLRVLGSGRAGGIVAGLAFGLSGFVVVSFLWPMVVSTVVWIPLLLLLAELIVRTAEGQRGRSAPLLVAAGATAIALQFLAGHLEMSYYALFALFFYSAARLLIVLWRTRDLRSVVRAGLLLSAMTALGILTAAIQLVPFVEVIGLNYRASGWSTYEQVIGYAMPKWQLAVFALPDLFGNPTSRVYLDLVDWTWRSVVDQVIGGRKGGADVVFWGQKNYVEAAGYVGVLTLCLAALALLVRRSRYVLVFAALAVWSLLLIVGSPLYAVLFYLVPGIEQLHTPFRWIVPYSVSVAVLAGLGMDTLVRGRSLPDPRERAPELARLVGLGLLAIGSVGTAGLIASLLAPGRAAAIGDSVLRRLPAAARGFADGRMLYSYELPVFLTFFVVAGASGALIYLGSRRSPRLGSGSMWTSGYLLPAFAVAILVAELFRYGFGFNSYTDPKLLTAEPPAVQFLRDRMDESERSGMGPFRIVSFGDEDVLKPVTAMLYGLQDARGYDTVIPRQYVEYWGLMEPPQGLPYSMIHKLVSLDSLGSPHLDALNVRYVLTTTDLGPNLDRLGLRLALDGETKVYENLGVLSRARLVGRSTFVADRAAALDRLRAPGFDPSAEVVLEGVGPVAGGVDSSAVSIRDIQITSYRPEEVRIRVRAAAPAYLVLADSYFPGWQARVDGEETEVLRANGNFRAVAVPAGEHEVVFKYSPMSFKLGVYGTSIGGAIIVLLLAVVLWRKLAGTPGQESTLRRVGRNSVAPMGAGLLNKVVDIGFAMLMLRVLGPEDAGKYTFAVVIVGYLDILTNFGLNALLMREVARDPESRHRYLTGSLIIRLGLWLLATPATIIILLLTAGSLNLGPDTLTAIALLVLALLLSNVSGALSSLFYAMERMEYPAVMTVVSNLIRISFGAIVLLIGWGIIGLAGVSLLVNVVTASAFVILGLRSFGRLRLEVPSGLVRAMIIASFPLMLNHLLATVFFKIDSVMLQAYFGSTVVGYYGAAYKFIDGMLMIPASVTFALFPMFSRHAGSDRPALKSAFVLTVRVLLMLSLPIAILTTALSDIGVLVLGGAEYLPHSAIALRVLIWFLPFSFVNGVTQYVLIAVNRQRLITIGFVVATTFNIAANLYAIPAYSYVGAGVVTVLSEVALMIPFYILLRRDLGDLPLVSLFVRPALAGLGMGGFLLLAGEGSLLLSAPASLIVYLCLLLITQSVRRDEALGLIAWVRARFHRPAVPEASAPV